MMAARFRRTARQPAQHRTRTRCARALVAGLSLLVVPAGAGAHGAPVEATPLIPPLGPGASAAAFAEGTQIAPAPATSAPASRARKQPPIGPQARTALGSSATCTPTWGSFRAGNWPGACWHPYGPESPFNVPIPASPRLSVESASIVKFMTGNGWKFEHNQAGNFTWDSGGSRPVYWSTSSDPIVTVTCRRMSCPAMRLHIPAAATPQEASDGHMTVVDQERGREYDFWQASKPTNGQMIVSAGKSIPIGNESGTGLEGDAEAARLGLLGGIVRASELAAGKIEHALVTTVKCVQQKDVWPSPASGTGDAVCASGAPGPHFASLLQLNLSDAEIAATHAPEWQQTIMKAMAHYGVYVVDTQSSSAMYLLAEDDLSFTSFGYPGQMAEFVTAHGGVNGVIAGVPIKTAKLRVIDPCVPQRTC